MEYIRKEEVESIENNGDVLACRYFHQLYPNGVDAIGDCGSEKVGGKQWDVFHIHYETKDAYYGIPMLGMGLYNCMILKSDTRHFLKNELGYKVGMYGSHTSKYISSCEITIEPIVNKY